VYHPCKEEISDDIPIPKGKSIQKTTFYDANLIFDYTTGKSATGIIHLCNKTPVDWYSSKNNPVECATIIANRIELYYLGCHIDGPTHLFGDNKSVVDTSMYPSYRLKKRCFYWLSIESVKPLLVILFVHTIWMERRILQIS
jgi:hypothetical protein